MNRSGPMVSVVLSGRSLPVIQWPGASKWVPVCSPKRNSFQYQEGPPPSNSEMTLMVTPGEEAN